MVEGPNFRVNWMREQEIVDRMLGGGCDLICIFKLCTRIVLGKLFTRPKDIRPAEVSVLTSFVAVTGNYLIIPTAWIKDPVKRHHHSFVTGLNSTKAWSNMAKTKLWLHIASLLATMWRTWLLLGPACGRLENINTQWWTPLAHRGCQLAIMTIQESRPAQGAVSS